MARNGQRIRRPAIDRFGPDRKWKAVPAAKPGRGAGTAPEPEQPRSASDPIARSVELGYTIVEQYMRRGQEAARSMWGLGQAAPAAGADFEQLGGRAFQSLTELANAWLGIARMVMEPRTGAAEPPASPGRESMGGFAFRAPAPSPAAAPVTPLRTTIRVTAARAVEVSVQWSAAPSGKLVVREARPVRGKAPALAGIEASADDTGATVAVTVPDLQPPGTYVGALVNARSREACAEIRIRIPR